MGKNVSLNILLSLCLMLLISACKKENNDPAPFSMKNMEVPQDFKWSVSEKYTLKVNVSGNVNGQTLRLYNKEGEMIDAQRIEQNQVNFRVRIQDTRDTVRIYSPTSFRSKYITTDIAETSFGHSEKGLRETDYALNLDGSDDYVEIQNNVNGGIVTAYPFTFSAWFRTTGAGPEDDDMVLVSLSDPNLASVYFGIELRQFGHFYKAQVKSRVGSKEYRKSTNQNVSDDTWHQIVGVFTADGKRKLYLDGVYEGMSSSVLEFDTDAVILNFGRWGDKTPNNYYHGLIDNVCIWNYELDEEEVAYYYNNNPQGDEEGLLGFYTFDEGTGGTIQNQSTVGGYDGITHGAGWENISETTDSDGDGVDDESDYWPEDAGRAYNSVYPSGSKYYFHLFEDLWPGLGDYDFNDVILKSKLHLYKNAENSLVGGRVISQVYWIGGGIPRGAGIECFESNGSATQLTYLPENTAVFEEVENVESDPLVKNAITLFNDNIIESLNDSVDFEFSWDHNQGGNSIWMQVYIYRDRDHEIHMIGHPPTVAANMALFGTANDASQTTWNWNVGKTFDNPSDFYKTNTNLPWGLEIIASEFRVPNERTEITVAYPEFREWAESGGIVNQGWYNNPSESNSHLPE